MGNLWLGNGRGARVIIPAAFLSLVTAAAFAGGMGEAPSPVAASTPPRLAPALSGAASIAAAPALSAAPALPPAAPVIPSSGPDDQADSHRSPLRRYSGRIGADLSASLASAGVPDVAARDYVAQMLKVERFAAEISVDDRFDLVVGTVPDAAPMLLYAGMDRVGRGDLQFLKYGDDDGRIMWVDAGRLEERGSSGFALPVGGRVTSGFGTRMHPLLGSRRFHRGIDLAATSGTPVRAAADGRVDRAGWRGGYGWQVALGHAAGLDTSYSHLSRILARPGQRVRRGDIIGLVGSTGLSTGPHLHFEATRNGRAIDPRSARIDVPVAMSEAKRTAFNGELRAVLTLAGS